MRTRNSARRASLALVLPMFAAGFLSSRQAFAVGEQNGRLSGAITEGASPAPIPGAKVSVTSPSLIGGPRETVSDEGGRYLLDGLPPGTYDVLFSIEGAKPVRKRIVIRQGETAPLNIAWAVELTETGVHEIVEKRTLTRPESTQTGTVLTADTQGRVATGRSYQNIALQTAGVSDRGGGGNPNVKGAQSLHNRYLVDGLDITDPVTNTFSANINFDSIGSVEVLTGGMEAQYNSLGGIINVITNGGSNKWNIDASVYVNNARFSAGRQFGNQVFQGVRPFAKFDPPPQQAYQANLNVGGPLVKNRLWMNVSFEYTYREAAIPIGPPLNVQHPPRIFQGFLGRLKLTYAPSTKHRITLSASADPATIENTSQSNNLLAVAEDRQIQGGIFSILQWDYFRSDKMSLNLQAGFQYNNLETGPQGLLGSVDTSGYAGSGMFSSKNDRYDPSRPQHFNIDDATTWYQGSVVQIDKRYTGQFDPSISLKGKWLGYHDAKIGIQSRFIYHSFYTEVPGNSVYSDAGGGPGEAGLCEETTGKGCFQRTDTPAYSNSQIGIGAGAFVQDRWRPWHRLTILPGLRFDYGYTRNSVGEVVSSQWGFGPRLGFTLDLTGDQKTILTGFYGRANETLSLLTAAYADVSGLATTYQWDETSKKFVKAFTSGGPGGYRLDPSVSPPHTDEVTVSLRREVVEGAMASIDYTFKRVQNIWDNVEVNQIWDPTGVRVVGYKNGTPEQIFLYTTPDANRRDYHGVDFVLEARPSQNFDFFAAYTLAFLHGAGAEQFAQISGSQLQTQFYNPRMFQFFDGFLPDDIRHQLKVRTSYTWRGLNLGVTLNYSTGTPLTKRFFNQNDAGYTVRRSPQGTDPGNPNDPNSITELRLPDLMVVNARASYDMHGLIRQHVILIADLFNVFNLGAVTALESRDVPNFGQARARQNPLRLQLGVRYLF